MGAHILILLAAVAVQSPQSDSAAFAESSHGLAYERLADAALYDRVQGLSLGLGYRVRAPVVRFTSLYTTVRYGVSDERVTGRLALVSDTLGARFVAAGYREIVGVDPFAPGRTLENSFNALFAAHDNGDYALATGGGLRVNLPIGAGLDLALGGRLERQQSVARAAESAVHDFLGGSGRFLSNPPIAEGTFGGGFVRLDGFGRMRWAVTADVLGREGSATGRLFGEVRRRIGGRSGATIRLKTGLATEPTFPQALFRVGGLHTVRGFEYGFRRAPAFWAVQLDVTPLRGRARPVLFLDAGQAARVRDLGDSRALVGGGVGLSLLRGWLRLDFSVPMSPDIGGDVRFDLIVRGVR